MPQHLLDEWFDDLEVGREEISRGRTVTETDVVSWCMFTGDWFPIHSDVVYSEESMFGERLAPGLMVMAMAGGLVVPPDSEAIRAQYGVDRVRYPTPTFIGDTIRVRNRVAKLEARDDATGIVDLEWDVMNQNGRTTCNVLIRVLQGRPAEGVTMTSYDSYSTLKCELDGDGVLLVLLNRPDKMNSLDETMVAELHGAMTSAADDASVRCVLITGEGRAFSAGRDISSAKPDEDAYEIITDHVNPMLAAIYHCPKPTISGVNGPAMGVGLGIALACDIVIAADNARMSSPFARLGVALDSGGHYFLPRLVGYHRAMEMVYTSDIIRGKQAAAWGLVNRSVPGTRLRDRSLELARRIATGPVNAFMAEKAFMREAQTMSYDEVCAGEAKLQGSLMGSPEYGEGLAAFSAKRAPDFSGIPLRADRGQP